MVLHFCILQCLCPRPLSTNYLLFLQPRGPWPPTVLQHSHSQCISAGYPLQKQKRFLDRNPWVLTVITDYSPAQGSLERYTTAVNLKIERFSKCGTELPTNSPTCSEDQKPFSGIRNSSGAVWNILCGRSGTSVTTGLLVRVVF